MTTTSPIVVALDFPSMDQALAMADQLDPDLCRVKVGKELYTATGPAILEELHKRNYEVFLDLKFHDIPNTCAKAVGVAADLGVWMVNVHASGGQRMMEAARNELEKKSHKPLLIGVTVLTSMEQCDLAGIGLDIEPMVQVERLAKLAQSSGMDGVVCSAREVSLIRDVCGPGFLTVTPGIRPEGADIGDQKRVMTPREAVEAGVDYMVIGRPVTSSLYPAEACESIYKTVC
ncbi:orotidine-5'-phosphate decarboxylase [uncultured Thalassolituus sp.]|uniref:orotidine-5'-phosphate decarboxylase n=1 Tax=uncultured Thalassolituus sp. TaxID=285273 RepID=UPI0026300804|nr:orotidine-5'-phosphate decarboxylase [uncultured Thalassolituus sp.]